MTVTSMSQRAGPERDEGDGDILGDDARDDGGGDRDDDGDDRDECPLVSLPSPTGLLATSPFGLLYVEDGFNIIFSSFSITRDCR